MYGEDVHQSCSLLLEDNLKISVLLLIRVTLAVDTLKALNLLPVKSCNQETIVELDILHIVVFGAHKLRGKAAVLSDFSLSRSVSVARVHAGFVSLLDTTPGDLSWTLKEHVKHSG